MRRRTDSKTLGDCFDSFLAAKTALGTSADTIRNYKLSFSLFLKDLELKSEDPISLISSDLINRWIMKMAADEKKPTSVNHYLRDIRAWVYYLQEQGIIQPFKIRCVKVTEESPKGYTEEELKLLLKKPTHTDSYTIWRSWAIVNFCMGTGARIGSIVTLQNEDIDLKLKLISFRHTKNKKHLQIPLTPALEAAIRAFRDEWDTGSVYLYPSDTGAATSPHGALQAHQDFCRSRGVRAGTLHELRHSFAREACKSGMPITTLQHMLGHSSIEMTAHYVNLLVTDLETTAIPLDRLINDSVKHKICRK